MLAKETTLMLLVYAGAALFEIAGCYALWMVLRLGKTSWWLIPGTVSLLLFAALLTRVDLSLAGRVFAAYGGSILSHRWPGCGLWKDNNRTDGI